MNFAGNKILKTATFITAIAMAATISVYLIKGKQDQKYKTYKSNDPVYNFIFEYPETWKVNESRGKTDDYAMVMVIGPRDEANEYSLGLAIVVKPLENKNENALLNEYMKSISTFQNFKIIKNEKPSIANHKAEAAVYEHAMRLPLRKLNAKDVLMKGKVFVVVKNEKLYRLDFFGTAELFRQNEAVLKRIIETFQFTELSMPERSSLS